MRSCRAPAAPSGSVLAGRPAGEARPLPTNRAPWNSSSPRRGQRPEAVLEDDGLQDEAAARRQYKGLGETDFS